MNRFYTRRRGERGGVESMNELTLLPKAAYTHGTHFAPSASPRETTGEDFARGDAENAEEARDEQR
jgi:hypothetical protein